MGLLQQPELTALSPQALLSGFAVLVAYYLVSATYNKVLSPLSKIPGPTINAISWLPWYKYWFSGYMHRHVLRLHEEYGKVVRIGPTEISFIDQAGWQDIYGLKRATQIGRDPQSFPALTPHGAKYDLLTYDAADHAKYRKILNPFFSERAVRQYEPTIHNNVDRMLDQIRQHVHNGKPRVNVTELFQWLSFDMITDVTWGDSFQCVANNKSHPCLALSMDLVSYSSFIVFVAWWKGLKDFLINLSGVEGLFKNLVRSKCEDNLKAKDRAPNVFSMLRKAGNPLDTAELDGNLTAIVIAGSETTGFVLTASTYYLARNPEYFFKAATEIRSKFSTIGDINDESLRQLPFLNAVIREALRLTPAEPNGLARKVHSDGINIAGQYIPKNTAIYVSQFAANRWSKYFTSPNDFRPERWLGDPSFKEDELDVVQPFILGVNSCIGRGLAWMEMRVTLAKLLWEFDWTIHEHEMQAFEESKAWHVWIKTHVHLQLLKRGTLETKM